MKKQKMMFNFLLRKYNKYKAKLERFQQANHNSHRQGVLSKHIARLQDKLYSLYYSINLKKVATVSLLTASMMLVTPDVNAQIKFAGAPFLINPFGLTGLEDFNFQSFADLDGDGDLDLITRMEEGIFYYFKNIGTAAVPVFAAPITNPFGLTGVGYGSPLFLVDLDGDGDLDVMSGENSGGFRYYKNTGTATAPAFAAEVLNPFGLTDIGGGASAPSLVDLDGDGDLDLISGEFYGGFFYFENTGTASAPAFAAPITNPFGLTDIDYFSIPTFVDLDGDGDFDMMVGDGSGDFSYFENTGTASSPAFALDIKNPFSLVGTALYSNPSFVDIDNDGDFDLISGSINGEFKYFQNVGTASAPDFSFSGPKALLDPFGLDFASSLNTPVLVDIDGDGDLDVMSGESLGGFRYYKNTGTATAPAFAAEVLNPFGLTDLVGASAPSFVDIDGDGDLDLISGEYFGSFYYFENTGSVSAPAFAAVQENPFGLGGIGDYFSMPTFVDLDGDGDFDMVSGGENNLYYFENTGTASAPAFATMDYLNINIPYGAESFAPIFADLDGDGDFDLMTGSNYGFLFNENIGTSLVPEFADYEMNPFSLYKAGLRTNLTFGDLDGDGDLDILAGYSYGDFYYFKNISGESTAIKKIIAENISVYPNPTNGILNIKTTENINVEIVDLLGKTIVKTTDKQIDLKNVVNGMYFVKIYDANYKLMGSSKILKK